MERVIVTPGKEPIILVAPHANEEDNIQMIVEEAAKRLKANSIINNGFKKSDDVDVIHDFADCARIDHLEEDVVRDEFLQPLLLMKRNLARKYGRINAYFINGLSYEDESKANNRVDLVLGYGQAVVNSSHTCPIWMVDMFINEWESHGWTSNSVYCGKPGGKFSARSVNHLPQIFRKKYPDLHVDGMQIFVSSRFRQDRGTASFCGVILANIMSAISQSDYFDESIDKYYL